MMPKMSHSALLPFGRHKGKTFRQVYEDEKGYVSCVQEVSEATGVLRQLQQYCTAMDNGTFQDSDVGCHGSATLTGNVGGNQFGGYGMNNMNRSGDGNSMNRFGGNSMNQFGNSNTQFGNFTTGNNPADKQIVLPNSVSFPSDLPVSPPEKKDKLTTTCDIYYELAGIDKVQVRFDKYVGTDLADAAIDLLKDDANNPATKSLLGDGEDNRAFMPEIVSGCIRWPAKYGERIKALLPERFGLPKDKDLEIEEIPGFVTKLAEDIKKKEGDLKTAPPVDARIFTGIRNPNAEIMELHPFQKEGIEFAIRAQGRCIIGDEMGLGKTVQGLGVAYYYRGKVDVWPCLIICPSSLRFVWKDEIKMWIGQSLKRAEGRDVVVQTINKGADKPDPAADFVIVSYNMVAEKGDLQARHDGKPYGMVIVDEAHNIKDKDSKRSKAVIKIAKKAQKVVLLTGTPVMNKACELFTLLDVVLPGFFDDEHGYTQYCKRYSFRECKYQGFKLVPTWTGAKRPEELHFMTKLKMIRRLKRDVLHQLPDKTRQKVYLEKSSMDKEKMEELRKLMQKKERDFDDFDPDDKSQSTNASEIARMYRLTAEAKVPAVMNYISDLLDNCPADKKVLLFGHHRFMLDLLEKKVKHMKLGFIRIDGNTKQKERKALVNQFQNDENVRIAVLSIYACGVGLTLTRSDHVVFAELCWVPGQMQQAEDRVHRLGQKHPVTIQYLCASDTLDEIMFKVLDKKTRNTSAILNGVRERMELKTMSDFRSIDKAGYVRRPQEVNDYIELYDSPTSRDELDKLRAEVAAFIRADDSLSGDGTLKRPNANHMNGEMNPCPVGDNLNAMNGHNMSAMNGSNVNEVSGTSMSAMDHQFGGSSSSSAGGPNLSNDRLKRRKLDGGGQERLLLGQENERSLPPSSGIGNNMSSMNGVNFMNGRNKLSLSPAAPAAPPYQFDFIQSACVSSFGQATSRGRPRANSAISDVIVLDDDSSDEVIELSD